MTAARGEPVARRVLDCSTRSPLPQDLNQDPEPLFLDKTVRSNDGRASSRSTTERGKCHYAATSKVSWVSDYPGNEKHEHYRVE